MSDQILVFMIMAFAVFTQSFLGFGSAMLAMSLLPAVIGIQLATPLFALLAVIFQPVLLFYYRSNLNIKAVKLLILSSLVGIPFGLVLLFYVPESITLPLLGGIIVLYGVFSLSTFQVPDFSQKGWAYLLGFVAGAFGGAYAVTGPPVIVYGHGRRWQPAEFKANLQAYFILTSIAIFIAHYLNGSYLPKIWPYIWAALPALLVGLVGGLFLDRFIKPEIFRKVVLFGVIGLGLGLIF